MTRYHISKFDQSKNDCEWLARILRYCPFTLMTQVYSIKDYTTIVLQFKLYALFVSSANVF